MEVNHLISTCNTKKFINQRINFKYLILLINKFFLYLVDSEMPELRDEENNPIYINAVFLPVMFTTMQTVRKELQLIKRNIYDIYLNT